MSASVNPAAPAVVLTAEIIGQVKNGLIKKPGIRARFDVDSGWFQNDKCAFCGDALTGATLDTQRAWDEYRISGMCQLCQDE